MNNSILATMALGLLGLAAPLALAAPATVPGGTTVPGDVKPGGYTLDTNHGKITWSVNHLGFSTYIGQFSGVTGTLTLDPRDVTRAKLTATVDMSSIGTLNPALDTVLKSDAFFNVAKYPTATFVSTRVLRTSDDTANVDGDLTLHGVTKPVVLKVKFNEAGVNPAEHVYIAGFDGKTTIKRSEFGITTYSGFLSDDIPLRIEGEFALPK